MTYSIRDLLGHFAKRPQEGKPCPHKCCRGRRPHPKQKPIIPDRDVLRAMSEETLIRHVHDAGSPDRLVEAAIAELDRRERAAERAGRRREARQAEQAEHALAIHAAYLDAERETRGHMLSPAGRAAGVDPRTLWVGPEKRAMRYASEELRNYWDDHGGRLTAADWQRRRAGERAAVEAEDERAARRRNTRGFRTESVGNGRLYGIY